MERYLVRRKQVAWLAASIVLSSLFAPILINPLWVLQWKLDLLSALAFSVCAVLWYVLDCRCLQVRTRWWLVLGALTFPFIAIPGHRFLETDFRSGAIFCAKLIGFFFVFVLLFFLLDFSLDEFCEPAVVGAQVIDVGGYFQFWGCF